MRYVLYALLGILGLLVLLLLAAVVRTLLMKKKKPAAAPETDPDRALAYARKLSRMVQYESVSVTGREDPEKYRGFHQVLRELFPAVFANCEFHDLEGSILLRWPGRSSEKPVLFLAHMDVVEANAADWTYPPFSGEIADGRLYGRGSGDTKCSLMAAFQSVEESIEEGIVPDQDVWIGSSCTEEVGGPGAPRMARWLKDHGVRLALLEDEGGAITSEPMKGLEGLYAMVGVYEKGFANFKFTARGSGGHSAQPPKNTPIPRLARFVSAVERRSPFRREFTPEVTATFEAMAPYAGFGYRLVLGNLWLFGPVLKKVLGGPAGAMLGTTCAFTMSQGSNGANVIPQEAWVVGNLRYASFQGEKDSFEVISRVAAKYGVETEILTSREATRPVDLSGKGFALVKEAEKAVYGDVPVVPYVVTGGTDARNFEGVADAVIRFSPVVYSAGAMKGQHGIDEYFEYASLPAAVDYYKYLIRNCGKLV